MPVYRLGPTLSATLCTPDLDATAAAWRNCLFHHLHSEGFVTSDRADAFGEPDLQGRRTAWLANDVGDIWLELIELPGATRPDPFAHYGWFSLEINVTDVDGLSESLENSAFCIIGEPANLDVSDDIRAMQVVGTAGEVLYLTEIKAAVPPFELPTARCAVDRVFIPVLFTENRDRSLAVYSTLNGNSGMTFDTRITVINQARGLPMNTRHPVATLQLAGCNLIEMDQQAGLSPRPATSGLPVGIAAIAFEVAELPRGTASSRIGQGPHAGRKAATLRGPSGEWIELIE